MRRDATRSSSRPRSARTSTFGWRAAVLVFVIVAAVHSVSPSVQVGDSRLSVAVATQVMRHGALDVESVPVVAALTNKYDVRIHAGHVLPFFPWPAMLFALPGSAAADIAGKDPESLKPSSPNQTWIIEVPTASVLVGLTSVVLALIAFGFAAGSVARRRTFAVGVALLFAFATGAWSTASRALWQHTPSMLFLSLALFCALRVRGAGRVMPLLLGLCLGAALVVRPTNAVAVVAFVVWIFVTHRRKTPMLAAGIAVVLVPFVLVNLAAYGSLLPPYYAGTRVGTEAAIPFFDAAAMYLVSPSRGILVYDPLILVAAIGVWVTIRRGTFTGLNATLVSIVVVQWLVVARYGSTGGSSFGPRLLTDTLPYVVFLALPALATVYDMSWRNATRHGRVALLAFASIVVWSVAVNASGALLRSAYCWSATPVPVDSKPSRIWDWSDPQFLRPAKVLSDGGSLHDVVLETCPASA